MLFNIENLKMKGKTVSQIAKELKITVEDVQNRLNKIYETNKEEE